MTRMDSGKFLESRDFLFHAAPYRFNSGRSSPPIRMTSSSLLTLPKDKESITIRESTTILRKATFS